MVAHRQPRMRPGHRPFPRSRSFPVPELETLFTTSRDALLLIDAGHTLRAVNPIASTLLEQPADRLCGRPWRDTFQLGRAQAQPWRQNPVVECLTTGRHQQLAQGSLLVCGDRRFSLTGDVLPVTSSRQTYALLALQLPTPAPAPSLATHNDHGHEHEMLLQHMSRLNTVSELATGIAHEMNQPLSAIMSFNQAALRLLGDDEPDIDRVSEALAETVNQTRRAAGILERLRAFVGRQGLHMESVAINQIVVNALTLLSSKITASGVRVSLRTEPCPPVRADALQLEQVMVNLVRNAVEAMETVPAEGRMLQVSTHVYAGRVHVTVTDSGPGLPEPLQTQLFTRFFTTKADGMGLGLSISRTIVEASGGELSAGNAPERGASFRFSLPVFVAEEIGHGSSTL